MGFSCGIVGLPNVGKSTLFNALTRAGVAAENYPFCTIAPHTGVVPVPDPRLEVLAAIVQPQKCVPTTLEFVDIAGLVKGAAQGEGLGNQFLHHIREVDAIAHVVRCFDDAGIVHVAGRIDPAADIAVIHTELALSDLATVERAHERVAKSAKAGDKEAQERAALLERLRQHLNAGGQIRTLALSRDAAAWVRSLGLLTAKPMMYIANVDDKGLAGNRHLDTVVRLAAAEQAPCVPICAQIEAELAELDDAGRAELLRAYGLQEPGLNRVIRAGYSLLGLQTFFTAGPKEVRAWTVPAGSTAPQAAGRIHSDFEKGFIRAEVIAYEDFVRYHGEPGAKEAGKWRLEGKDYVMQEGDVVHFRFHV